MTIFEAIKLPEGLQKAYSIFGHSYNDASSYKAMEILQK